MSYKSGLDPENDPVVYTTDYGLEIRYASAVTNSYLAGYTYFTMGEYDGNPVNWLIIGYDPSMHEYVQDVSGEAFRDNLIEGGDWSTQLETLDDSAAGSAILLDGFAISEKAVTNFEIGDGRVLCFSELNIFNEQYYPSSYTINCYSTSNIRVHVDNLYTSTLNLSDAQKSKIKPQDLVTTCYHGLDTPLSAYFFPLAYSFEENFCFRTYLQTTESINIGAHWWLRSGLQDISRGAYRIDEYGKYDYYSYIDHRHGIRPAFVLEL